MDEAMTADRLFQVALELEETGQIFYEALAASTGNRQVAALARRLAQQELDHFHKFERMRRQAAQAGPAEPMSPDELVHVQQLVREKVIPSEAGVRRIAATAKLGEALEVAIRMEEDSVTFYSAMLTAEGVDADAVRKIIDEEKAHVRTLSDARVLLK